MLLRVLFPSWRFFEDLDWIPQLSFKLEGSESWIEVFEPETRCMGSLFLNARGNFRLAANSLVEQFTTDMANLKDDSKLEETVSYQLVRRLVEFRIKELGFNRLGLKYQFKVVSLEPGKTEKTVSDPLMISATHEWALC